MRHLIVCPRCRRQYDAGDRAPGTRFRCSCGGQVTIEAPAPREAAVIRCSACGAPREGEEAACRYCGSSFTVHDRDLDTLCPACMARVSGTARFCHHCGSPILVGQATDSAAAFHCPACPGEILRSRQLGEEAVAVAECARCGGLWLDNTVFEIVATRARRGQLGTLGLGPASPASGPRDAEARLETRAEAGAPRRLYRPCAVCGALMNRTNYGRSSGVILDVCRTHGIWFDCDELPRLLAWIREGGEERARRRAAEEAQEAARQHSLADPTATTLGRLGTTLTGPAGWDGQSTAGALLTDLAALLGDGLRHLFRPR
jgi:Zn-finger nucleic acid-binding protein